MSRTYGKAQDLIDFTRGSGGTALRRVKYGAELVTNGTFDSSDGWSLFGGATISGGVLTVVSSGEGVGAQQNILTVGKVYFITVDVVVRSGTVKVQLGSASQTPYIISSSGTYTFARQNDGTDGNLFLVRNAACDADFDNVSVKEVIFDTSDGDLILFNHPTNVPRIEYDASGNLLGLLVEESRTNLAPYSDDFSASEWIKYYSIAVSPSAVVSPDGQQNAYELTGIESSDGDIGLTDMLVTSPSTTYTASIWVKAANTSDVGKYVKLRSKRNGGTFVAGDQEIQLTSEWVRHSVTITLLADNTGASLTITKATAYPLASRADSCLIYRAQYEQGSFPTSAIPTSGSTATRSADVASLSTSAFGYRQDEGSVVVEALVGQDTFASMASLQTGLASVIDRISLLRTTPTALEITISTPSGTQLQQFEGFGGDNTENKIGVSFKENSGISSFNGNIEVEDTTLSVPTTISVLMLGRYGNSNYLNGHIKSLKYIPRRLTNAQLQELTS